MDEPLPRLCKIQRKGGARRPKKVSLSEKDQQRRPTVIWA
ncbi:hypothetical protein CCP3SC15_1170014 [Gammaproteobacteria bacterium]